MHCCIVSVGLQINLIWFDLIIFVSLNSWMEPRRAGGIEPWSCLENITGKYRPAQLLVFFACDFSKYVARLFFGARAGWELPQFPLLVCLKIIAKLVIWHQPKDGVSRQLERQQPVGKRLFCRPQVHYHKPWLNNGSGSMKEISTVL